MSNEKRKQQSNEALMAWLLKQENGEEAWVGNVWSAAVEWADSHPQWIPVEEELPKADGRYIIANKYGGVEQMNFDAESKCWWLRGTGWMRDFVTHWMLMPTPPARKEAKNEQ